MSKLKDGQQVTINIPFIYTIGDEGFNSGKVLRTIEDCENEVLAEIRNGVLDGDLNVMMEEGSEFKATQEQVKDTATNIIRLAQRLGHLPIELHDSICHEIKELLKLD